MGNDINAGKTLTFFHFPVFYLLRNVLVDDFTRGIE